MANTQRPFGVASISTGPSGPKRTFGRFSTLSRAARHADERRDAGDTVLHIEQKIGEEWHVVARFTDDGQSEPLDEPLPRRLRISHLTEQERAQRFFPRWRLAVLERQNHLCECGQRATTVGYPPGTKRASGERLDVDALIAVCDKCAGEPGTQVAA